MENILISYWHWKITSLNTMYWIEFWRFIKGSKVAPLLKSGEDVISANCQSICVEQILVHLHTLHTIAFHFAHTSTSHVYFFMILPHPHPHTSPRPQRQNALYDMHVTYQITPKLVVEFDKSTIIYIERHFKVQRKKC